MHDHLQLCFNVLSDYSAIWVSSHLDGGNGFTHHGSCSRSRSADACPVDRARGDCWSPKSICPSSASSWVSGSEMGAHPPQALPQRSSFFAGMSRWRPCRDHGVSWRAQQHRSARWAHQAAEDSRLICAPRHELPASAQRRLTNASARALPGRMLGTDGAGVRRVVGAKDETRLLRSYRRRRVIALIIPTGFEPVLPG